MPLYGRHCIHKYNSDKGGRERIGDEDRQVGVMIKDGHRGGGLRGGGGGPGGNRTGVRGGQRYVG